MLFFFYYHKAHVCCMLLCKGCKVCLAEMRAETETLQKQKHCLAEMLLVPSNCVSCVCVTVEFVRYRLQAHLMMKWFVFLMRW